jgi:hypothetical protein
LALNEFQRAVAVIAMRVAGPLGFAVGGGLALQLRGLGDRPTQDLDSYSPRFDAAPFTQAAEAVVRALRQAGYGAGGRVVGRVQSR